MLSRRRLLCIMLKFFVKVFISIFLLNTLMDQVDTFPDVRYWSDILCCTMVIHLHDIGVKFTDLENLCKSFWIKFLEFYIS